MDKLQQLGLAPHEISAITTIANGIAKDGALSARHLEGIVILLRKEIAQRIAGHPHTDTTPTDLTMDKPREGTDDELFKVILGEMIAVKYEHMTLDLVVRIGAGAVAQFCKKYGVGFEYMVTPKK